MKWYNKAVIYNKTAYFIINFCFIKPKFYRKTPLFFCKNQKTSCFVSIWYWMLNSQMVLMCGVIDYAKNFYGWRSSETSAASHFQKKLQKDSYIDLKKLHWQCNLTIVTSFDDEKDSLIILFSMAKEHFLLFFILFCPLNHIIQYD